MRLTKQEFIDALYTYQNMCYDENELANNLNISEWTCGEWVGEYYNFLEEMCELPEDIHIGNDLSYFCYELDFGNNWTEGLVHDEEGNDIKLQSPEDLWNYLVQKGLA